MTEQRECSKCNGSDKQRVNKNVAVYYLKDFPRVPAELGLQFVRHYYLNNTCDICRLVFKVIDKHKFFLAKIKYGI